MPRITHPAWTFRTPQWVVFDLDGTLADITHRLCYIYATTPEEKREELYGEYAPDWDKFNMECSKDEPKNEIIELLKMCQHYGKSIAILSGRMETAKERTIEWLHNNGIKYDILEMRRSKDYRSDVEVKREMFFKHFNIKQVWFVVDDRDKVVNLWRELGLTCLQCQKGDY